MEIFISTLNQMLVMFLFILVGFITKKMSLLPDNTGTVLSKLENYVLVPALVLDTFMSYCHINSLAENYNLILYAVLLLAIAVIISISLSKYFAREKSGSSIDKEYQRNIYNYALTFGNFSFMGNAIVLGVLGDAGLFKYLLFTLPLNIAVYTWGIMILVPKDKCGGNPLKNLLNPIFVALVIGLILGLLNAKSVFPPFILTTVSNAKSCMGPIAMLLTGFVIGGYDIKSLLIKKRIYIATVLRLFIIPALLILVLRVLGASDEIMTLALFAFATPLGLNTIVFPAAYGGDTKTGASMAMISHTVSVISIPIMYLLFIVLL